MTPRNAEFKNFKQEFPEAFWKFQFQPEYFDLWAIARMQLEQCGVLSHHIEIARICTFENEKDFLFLPQGQGEISQQCNLSDVVVSTLYNFMTPLQEFFFFQPKCRSACVKVGYLSFSSKKETEFLAISLWSF